MNAVRTFSMNDTLHSALLSLEAMLIYENVKMRDRRLTSFRIQAGGNVIKVATTRYSPIAANIIISKSFRHNFFKLLTMQRRRDEWWRKEIINYSIVRKAPRNGFMMMPILLPPPWFLRRIHSCAFFVLSKAKELIHAWISNVTLRKTESCHNSSFLSTPFTRKSDFPSAPFYCRSDVRLRATSRKRSASVTGIINCIFTVDCRRQKSFQLTFRLSIYQTLFSPFQLSVAHK